MDRWQKENLGLQVGDTIIWQDEAVDTYASQLLAQGEPVTYVSQLLGHANPQITFKVYAHWIPNKSQRQAVNRLPSLSLGRDNTQVEELAR